jgi:branched-chain amino acid transport system substrate-binding protein
MTRIFALALAAATLASTAAQTAEPIRIGFSDQLSGSQAPNGRGLLLGIEIWAEQVNARGGLLGRPVELVYYDDQSNPALDPGIYTKLLDVDKVDLLYCSGTNASSTIMSLVMEHQKVLFNSFALNVNAKYHYKRYFQSLPYGPDGQDAISRGFFEAAMAIAPKPKTVALLGSDSEFSNNALIGARGHAKRLGLDVVYDKTYPPTTIDFAPIVHVLKAAAPDLIFVASYTQDSVGIIRAANEVGLDPKLFGGAMIGLPFTAVKAQLGEMLNRLLGFEVYANESTMRFPGIEAFLAIYQARAKAKGVDLLGYYSPVQSYATFQVMEQTVAAVGSLDQDKIADYAHSHSFTTVMGELRFGPDGEWAEPRLLTVQYRNVHGRDPQQFAQPGVEVIVYPPQYKSGDLLYPYQPAVR